MAYDPERYAEIMKMRVADLIEVMIERRIEHGDKWDNEYLWAQERLDELMSQIDGREE